MSAFLPLCLPPSQYLNLVRFACSWARLDTQELPKSSPQNHLYNDWVVVEVSPSIFAFSSYADPLLGTLIWFVSHVPGLIQRLEFFLYIFHKSFCTRVKGSIICIPYLQ